MVYPRSGVGSQDLRDSSRVPRTRLYGGPMASVKSFQLKTRLKQTGS